MDGLEKFQAADYAKEFDAIRGACGTENNVGAIGKWLAGLDFSLPEGRCNEFLVILKTSSQDVFIGRLADVSSQYLIFDYLVLEKTLLDHINSAGEVKLKRDSDCRTTLEPASCIILSDFSIPDGSFFSMPMRRCVLQLVEIPSIPVS
ncbi:MAG: hypothetical protein AB9866_02870 [Syntrophobacteraceae bacterium]